MLTESDALLASNAAHDGGGTTHTTSRGWWGKITKSLGILLVIVAIAAVGSLVWWKTTSAAGRHDVVLPSSSHPRYTATQFISLTINTLGGSAKHGECHDRDVDPTSGTCYLGNSTDLNQDIQHRIDLIDEILVRLKDDAFDQEPKINRNSNVLKIFMLPEFFLRGPNGAYTFEQLYGSPENGMDGILIQMSDQLKQIIADEAFDDYLFLFGTIIAIKSRHDDPTVQQQQQEDEQNQTHIDANQLLYYNYAPVIKGGKGHEHYYLVTKKYISTADFLSREKLPNPRDTDLRYYADPSNVDAPVKELLAKRGNKLNQDNLIEIDGIRIGIEICLDHRMGQLWKNLQQEHNSELVHVQLITSAGMAIERGPNPVVPNGVVYLSDGGASSAACWRTDNEEFHPDTVCRQHPRGPKHLPTGGPGFSNFFPMAFCIDVAKSDAILGYYSLHMKQGCANTLRKYGIHVMEEFKYYPPSVEIYPTVDLPW